MSQTMSDPQALVAALAEEALAAAGEHPELDRLLDYHAGRLEPEAEKRLQDHFVGCRRCARRLLELEPFAEPDLAAEGRLADFEVENALRRLESRIEEERRTAAFPSRRLLYVAAASFLVVAVGFAGWTARLQSTIADLRRQVDTLTRPQVNFPVVYLDAPVARGGTAPAVVDLPAGKPFWTLVVIPENPRPWPEYEVVLLAADGTELWRAQGLEWDEGAGGITLWLARGWLPAGEYRLRLDGLDGERRESEGLYRLRSFAE